MPKNHRTFQVATFIMATDAKAMMEYILSDKWSKAWRRSNDKVMSGEHMFTAKESIIREKFPGICHWQVNLARQISIELEEHVVGELRPEIPNDIEAVCDRFDEMINSKLGLDANRETIDELYYQATVAFRWRWAFREELPPESETNVVPLPLQTGEEENRLRVMRKVFAFATDITPSAFFQK